MIEEEIYARIKNQMDSCSNSVEELILTTENIAAVLANNAFQSTSLAVISNLETKKSLHLLAEQVDNLAKLLLVQVDDENQVSLQFNINNFVELTAIKHKIANSSI